MISCFSSFLIAQSDALPLKPTKDISFSTNEGTWMNIDVSPDGNYIVFLDSDDQLKKNSLKNLLKYQKFNIF